LIDALPPGSYLVASHITGEHDPVGPATGARAYQAAGLPAQLRDSDEFAQLAFSDLDLVPPGVTLVSEWRPQDSGLRPSPAEVSWYGGVARIPTDRSSQRRRVLRPRSTAALRGGCGDGQPVVKLVLT
jgi:hypothetical protein